ncbi:hypothetical protein OQA88_11523 [Cercophora sp. LCS_1]
MASPSHYLGHTSNATAVSSGVGNACALAGTAKSLWGRAYDALKEDEKQLVKDYEELLLKEAQKQGHDPNGNAVAYSLDEASRQTTLDAVMKQGLQQMEDNTKTINIAGKTVVLREKVAEAAKLVLWAKNLVAEATKASPEASIAWVGICLFLPLLTNPSSAADANRDGFMYVTARMNYYAALEPLLCQLGAPGALKNEADGHIVDLYRHILEFQISSVLRFYYGSFKRWGTDVLQRSDWKKMRDRIEKRDAIVNQNLAQLGGLATTRRLESIVAASEAHHGTLQSILSISMEAVQLAKDQLSIATDHRDISMAQLDMATAQLGIAQDNRSIPEKQLDMQRDAARHKLSEEQQKCLHLFRLTDAKKDATYEWYRDRVEDRLDGTCQWFLRHQNFTRWRDQTSGPLLVSADPGCGKSVLAKYLVTKVLPQQPGVTVCYFFFKDGDQNTMRQALCALLHQLFCAKLGLIQHAMTHFKNNGSALASSNALLWDIFENAVRDPDAGPVTMVIDALDECDGSELESLTAKVTEQFCRRAGAFDNLKYLLTSRPYDQVISSLRDLSDEFPHVRIPGEEESDTISEEVNAVVKHRVNRMHLPSKVKARLEDRLLEIPHRTYLWVYLIFDHLKRASFKKTEKGIETAIATLPRNVNEAYEQILQRSTEPDLSRKALSIILAANGPLTLSEMNNAVNVDHETVSFEDLDLEEEDDFCNTLRSWCGLFISVHHGKVYFLHQTAREFLLADSTPNPESNMATGPTRSLSSAPTESNTVSQKHSWYRSITHQDAHRVLATACVSYLHILNEDDAGGLFKNHDHDKQNDAQKAYLESHPFLWYSSRNWPDHFRGAHFKIDAAITPFTLTICDPKLQIFPKWWGLYAEKQYAPPGKPSDLIIASYLGHDNIAQVLLARGAELEAKDDKYGRTPLSCASGRGHEAVVKQLLEHGANVEAEDEDGQTPLCWASTSGHEAVVKRLLGHGANVEAEDENGQTPLSWASEGGHEAVVEQLLAHGANVGVGDGNGRTPLSRASERGYEAVVKQLLAHKASVDIKDIKGRTPLCHASGNGYEVVVEQLLAQGAELEARDNISGQTPLLWASERGHETVVKRLLEHGANVDAENKRGQTPLSRASERGYEAVVKRLLEHGANVEAKDDIYGRTPLSWALERGHEAVVKQLLEHGANVDAEDTNGRTPLSWASGRGREAVVKQLLAHGADVEAKDNGSGKTPLSWASERGYEAFVQLLLKYGANSDSVNFEGRTPLLALAQEEEDLWNQDSRENRERVVGQLLEYGAHVNLKDNEGRTPLSWATERGKEVIVQLLLKHGANINSVDSKGRTPLLFLAQMEERAWNQDSRENRQRVVGQLLEHGADVNLKDNEGRTPLSWAIERGKEAIVQLLLAHGANRQELAAVERVDMI